MTRPPRIARICIPPRYPTASTYLVPSAPLSGKTRNTICKLYHLGVIALAYRRAASVIFTSHPVKRDLYIAMLPISLHRTHIAACTNSYAPCIRSRRFRTSERPHLSIPRICLPSFLHIYRSACFLACIYLSIRMYPVS
ncbi:hypothetical protein FKP32DRAFT_868895 [Trametes sanguinea]|nr:hypothetical protein FKP32DRAFT_868895 [Trametes sanguinea]